jgi:hypothetical protein
LTIAKSEEPIVSSQPEPEIELRYAETDDEIDTIHQFLSVVALPVLRCPINPKKSHDEVKRIVRDKTALMAMIDGELVGSMGLIDAVWWYGDVAFLTDRWHFCFPVLQHGAVNKALISLTQPFKAVRWETWTTQSRCKAADTSPTHQTRWPRKVGCKRWHGLASATLRGVIPERPPKT